jgi:hypothetical protein
VDELKSPSRSRPTHAGYRSHLLPRSREGWVAVVLFLGLLAMAEPPMVHTWANRTEPWILGVPFLYGYLLAVYIALIGVLLWVLRRRI